MGYLKYIKAYTEPAMAAWSVNADQAYTNLSTLDRCGFMFEQSLFLRYLFLAYGGALPTPLRNYATVVQERLAGLIQQSSALDLDDALEAKCASMIDICRRLLNGAIIHDPIRVKDMYRFISASAHPYPRVATQDPSCTAFYDAFIVYLCPDAVRSGYTVKGDVSLPSICLNGHNIDVCYDAKFAGYKMDRSLQTTLLNSQVLPNSIFEFWSGYNWSTESWLQKLLGILTSYSFSLDRSWLFVDQKDKKILDESEVKFNLTGHISTSSNEAKIFTFLRQATVGYDPVVKTPFDSLETNADVSFRRLFVSFLIGLRRRYNITFDSDGIQTVSLAIGNGEDALKSYLLEPSSASTEAIKAFQASVFSEFDEFYPENRIDSSLEETATRIPFDFSQVSIEENLKALRERSIAITGPAPFMNAKKDNVDESDPSATGNDTDQDEDESTGSTSIDDASGFPDFSDLGNDESGDVGATDDDDTSGTKSDREEDDSTTENDDDTSDDDADVSDTSRNKISMHPVPPLPDVSDKEGVKLELTSSENTDTVFYRMELKTYIDSILDNPPKTLSPQKIQVLRRIESFWLNILTPQCIHDLLNSIIRLPSMFQIHKGKHK